MTPPKQVITVTADTILSFDSRTIYNMSTKTLISTAIMLVTNAAPVTLNPKPCRLFLQGQFVAEISFVVSSRNFSRELF